MKELLRTEKLCRFFHPGRSEEIQALVDVDLVIRENEYVVFHGPSGSGKTTLLSLLGSLDLPSRGKVFLEGEDLTLFSEAALARVRRETLGFVFQSFNLIPQLPAWENVALPLIPLGIRERDRFRRAARLMEELGLGQRLYQIPEELSGGEQQRVAIARALINDPRIIIADEPTSNIDAASATRLLETFKGLQAEGKTLIVSAHAPVFSGQADVVHHLRAGRLVEPGEESGP